MGKSRVVKPNTKKLLISNDDWLLVRKRLNHGERTAAFQRRYLAGTDGVRVNLQQTQMAQVTAYLIDWSLVDEDTKGNEIPLEIKGQPIEILESMLNSLDPEDFDEIATAIETHEKAMLAERTAEKNARTGESKSPETSDSPAPPA